MKIGKIWDKYILKMARKQTKARRGKKGSRRTRRNGRKMMKGSGLFGYNNSVKTPTLLTGQDFNDSFSAVRKERKAKIDFATYTLTYNNNDNKMYFDFAVANKVESGSLMLKSTAFFANKKEVVGKINALLNVLKKQPNDVVIMYPEKKVENVLDFVINEKVTLPEIAKLRILTSGTLTESVKDFLIDANNKLTFVKKDTIDTIPNDILEPVTARDGEIPASETAPIQRSNENIDLNAIGQNDEQREP
jgi:hypothetical protein